MLETTDSDDAIGSWIENIEAPPAGEGERWEDNFVTLMTKEDLDLKILEVGDSPRMMADVSDREGTLLVRKYDPIGKQIWQRLRARSDVPQLHFICEKPIRVVDEFNLEFFNYEDYLFLGAYLAERGRNKSAGTLFTEALKSEIADAYVNKGVFHFRSGATGVFDNYRLAKKHFEKGIAILHKMKLGPEDENRRRKVCRDAIDEIDFRTSRGLAKLFRTIFRLLRLHFERDIFYVGVADRKSLAQTETIDLIRGTIVKYELQMMKDCMESFIYTLKLNIPVGSEDTGLTLDGLMSQIRAAQKESELTELLKVLSDIHLSLRRTSDRIEKTKEQEKRDAAISLLDRLSTDETAQIKRLDAMYSLKSPRELADMAERKDIDRILVLWLFKERSHIKMIMEALFQNPNVPSDVKKEIETRLGFKFKAS